MGVFISPTSDVVIGYYNGETKFCSGIQITVDHSLLLGNWDTSAPLDVDLYHFNSKRERMFSQIRNGVSVEQDKVQRL
jgi:hypothetical protein